MKGVNSMEVFLISTIVTAIALIVLVRIVKPQTHVEKTELPDLSELVSVQALGETLSELQRVKQIAINNERKFNELNDQLLNEIARSKAEVEGLESELDQAQDHIARLRQSVQRNDQVIQSIDRDINESVKRFARPLLVKLIQDKSLRTYTIEKVKRTKTGYEKKSLTRIVKKKTQPIKKLNLPGTSESKDALVQSGL